MSVEAAYDVEAFEYGFRDGHEEGYAEGYEEGRADAGTFESVLNRAGFDALEDTSVRWDAAERAWRLKQGEREVCVRF